MSSGYCVREVNLSTFQCSQIDVWARFLSMAEQGVNHALIRHKWWRHQMKAFSPSLALCEGGIHRSPVDSTHKGQWREALVFPLICAWTNSCVSSQDAGDLRRHCTRSDVALMRWDKWPSSHPQVPGFARNSHFIHKRFVSAVANKIKGKTFELFLCHNNHPAYFIHLKQKVTTTLLTSRHPWGMWKPLAIQLQ